ncbi:MAG: helix-turn-helix domain-containing protein [Methanocorpusculum parvum]|nr:helix-turn-helix domain-containing protein [Methanocorpusculum parvum]
MMHTVRSREELSRLIEEEGSATRVARRVGCSRQTVSKAMKMYGLCRRGFVASEEARRRLSLR